MTPAEKLEAKIGNEAEDYSLAIEWRGDDYGIRKQYYVDSYKAGASSLAPITLRLVETLEKYKYISCEPDNTTQYSEAAECLSKFRAWLEGEKT